MNQKEERTLFEILMQARFDMLESDDLKNETFGGFRYELLQRVEELANDYAITTKMSTDDVIDSILKLDVDDKMKQEFLLDLE